MAERYTSVKVILDNLLDHPLLQNLSFERAVKYSVEFMQLVGCPNIFEEKTAFIKIDKYKGELPCDYINMIQVRMTGDECVQGKCFRYSTDTFHMSSEKALSDLTYKVQGGYIFTSIKEGLIEIAYHAILVDGEGYPMLPENSSFERALEAYIKMKQFTILFDMGKITANSFENAKQDYAWAVGDCASEFVRLTLDKSESFFNSWSTLLLRTHEHSRRFINDGYRESLTFN